MAELAHRDLVYGIVGCAIRVLNELGHGMREKAYERALCIEFRHQNIAHSQQLEWERLVLQAPRQNAFLQAIRHEPAR